MKAQPAILLLLAFTLIGRVVAQEQVQIHGLLQLRALGIVDTSIYDGYTQNTFYSRRGEIAVSSTMLEKKFRWEVRIDPIAFSSKIVQDAYAEYSFLEEAKVRFGQFKYPQSLEGQWPSGKLDFIRRSIVGRTYGDKRDIGVQLSGTSPFVDYAVGLFNGNGRNTVDNNSQKDIAGRVTLHATEGLNVGGSFYEGTFLYAAGTPLAHNGTLERFGGDLRLNWQEFTFQSEYMVGTDDTLKSHGWYAQIAYLVAPWKPTLRIEQFDPNTHRTGQETTVFTVGVAYFLNDAVSVALDALLVDDKQIGTNANQLVAQWQVIF